MRQAYAVFHCSVINYYKCGWQRNVSHTTASGKHSILQLSYTSWNSSLSQIGAALECSLVKYHQSCWKIDTGNTTTICKRAFTNHFQILRGINIFQGQASRERLIADEIHRIRYVDLIDIDASLQCSITNESDVLWKEKRCER